MQWPWPQNEGLSRKWQVLGNPAKEEEALCYGPGTSRHAFPGKGTRERLTQEAWDFNSQNAACSSLQPEGQRAFGPGRPTQGRRVFPGPLPFSDGEESLFPPSAAGVGTAAMGFCSGGKRLGAALNTA